MVFYILFGLTVLTILLYCRDYILLYSKVLYQILIRIITPYFDWIVGRCDHSTEMLNAPMNLSTHHNYTNIIWLQEASHLSRYALIDQMHYISIRNTHILIFISILSNLSSYALLLLTQSDISIDNSINYYFTFHYLHRTTLIQT